MRSTLKSPASDSSAAHPRLAQRRVGATKARATLPIWIGLALSGLVAAGCGEEPAPQATVVRPERPVSQFEAARS